jgi:WD40 repeat protein
MPRAMLSKAFRLFVSSTFADFAAEREVLQAKVFPRLDEYCAAKGYQFYPLDLRWGISEEAGRDQRTADICLEEVEAANGYPPPNFLILLGDRYGWVPLPFAIARDEYEAMLAWLDARGDQDGADTVRFVYRLDENRLVPSGLKTTGQDVSAYTLRSREDDLPEELKAREKWKEVEDRVRDALQQASGGLHRERHIDLAALDKYHLSLTEREIRGNLDSSTLNGRAGEAIAFIRTLDGPCDAFRECEPQKIAAVAALKKLLVRTLPADRIASETAKCDATGTLSLGYVAAFASAIEAKIKEAIDRHIAKVEALEHGPKYALETEREMHRAFRGERLKIFVGRKSNRDAISRYLGTDEPRPLVLHGPSGSGKSALLARAIEEAEKAGRTPLVTRFIGASAGSSDLRALLLSLVDELAARDLVVTPAEYEQDANKFSAQIKALLVSISGPTVIFLDALDQLKKPYRLDWLPESLAKGVRLVLSVLDDRDYEADSEVFSLLWQRLPPDAFLAIEPLTAHGRDILMALEARGMRRLRDSQRDFVLRHFEAAGASPLYLRTAFEIAKSWRSWEANAGRHVLASDTTSLIAQFISDLTSKHHHEPELVRRTLGLLTAAKDGLSAKELTNVLSNDDGVMAAISAEKHGHRTKKLPPSVWVRLHRALQPFLTEKRIDDQPLLHFFHRQVAEVARTGHYNSAKAGLHAALAKYFEERATKQDGRAIYEKRSLAELPYQLHHSSDAKYSARLNEILLSPNWMQQKLVAFASSLPLVEDYRAYGRTPEARLTGNGLQLSASIVERDPSQLLPQLLGRLRPEAMKASDFAWRARAHLARPALVPVRPSLTPPEAEIARLEGHGGAVNDVTILPDGRLASASADQTIKIWDLSTYTEIGCLTGHAASVNALALLADGRLASASSDKCIKIWNVQDQCEVQTIHAHREGINTLCVLSGGRLASGSNDGTITLWDLSTGLERVRLSHLAPKAQEPEPPTFFQRLLKRIHRTAAADVKQSVRILALASLADGHLVSAADGYDGNLRLWDLETGEEVARFSSAGSIPALLVLPDGRIISGSDFPMYIAKENPGSFSVCIEVWDLMEGRVVRRLEDANGLDLVLLPDGKLASGSDDGMIRVWDIGASQQVYQLRGHTSGVNALAACGGNRLVSGSSDMTIRVWDLAAPPMTDRTKSHSERVNALVRIDYGRVASASGDGTIKIWDIATGDVLKTLVDDGDWLYSLAVLPDGHLVSGGFRGAICYWDPISGEQTSRWLAHGGRVQALALLPSGSLVSTTTEGDGSVKVWRPGAGAAVPLLEIPKVYASWLVVLGGDQFAIGSGTGPIRLCDARTRSEIRQLGIPTVGAEAAAALSDIELLTASRDGALRRWDIARCTEVARIDAHKQWSSAVAVLPNNRLASASMDKMIRLWDLTTNSECTRLEIDAAVTTLLSIAEHNLLIAGDNFGNLHWLEILD